MRLISRIGTTLSAAALAAGGFTIAGAGVAEATHGHCGYPPGQCTISFDLSAYFPGETGHLTTDKAFKRGETVSGRADCAKGRHFHLGPYTANSHHRVNGSFDVPKPFPRGTCSVTLHGHTSGWTASGSFYVKHHKHHHHGTGAISGQSSGGAQVLGLSTTRTPSNEGAAVPAAAAAASTPTASGLPFTGGAYTIPMAITGGLLFLAGAGLLVAVRRRRHANGLA